MNKNLSKILKRERKIAKKKLNKCRSYRDFLLLQSIIWDIDYKLKGEVKYTAS